MQVGTALFSTTQNVNFKGEIIDSHVHTGKFMGKKYGSNSLDLFVKRPLTVQIQDKRQKDTVSKMLISNLDCMNREVLSDETSGNVDMMKLCKKNKKFFPIAVCEPDQTNGDSTNIRNLLNKYKGKFVGLNFTQKQMV